MCGNGWPSRELVESNVDTSYLAYLRPVAQPLMQFASGHFPPGSVTTPHQHPCIVLHGCLNGPIELFTSRTREVLDVGRFFLLPSFETHYWQTVGDRTASTLGLLIDTANPGDWPRESGVARCCEQLSRLVREPKLFDANADAELRAAYWQAADILMLDQPRSEAAVNGVLWLLLGLIADRLEPKPEESQDWNESARRIRRVLLARVAESPGVEEIAREVHMSLTRAKKVFAATYGCGIKTYFNELKLYHAKRLLADRNLSVAQISSKLGFSSPSYFCRMFRTKTGQSPSECRADMQTKGSP